MAATTTYNCKMKNSNLVNNSLTDNQNAYNNFNIKSNTPVDPNSPNNNTSQSAKRSSKYYTFRNSKELNKEFEKFNVYNLNSQNVYTNISAGMVPNNKSSQIENNNIHYYPLINHPMAGQSPQSTLIDQNRMAKTAHRNSKLATVTPSTICPQLAYEFIQRPSTSATPVHIEATIINSTFPVVKQDANMIGTTAAIDKRYSMNVIGFNSSSCKQHQQLVPPSTKGPANKINENNCLTYSYFSNKNYTLGRKGINNKKEDRASVYPTETANKCSFTKDAKDISKSQTNSIKESLKTNDNYNNNNNNNSNSNNNSNNNSNSNNNNRKSHPEKEKEIKVLQDIKANGIKTINNNENNSPQPKANGNNSNNNEVSSNNKNNNTIKSGENNDQAIKSPKQESTNSNVNSCQKNKKNKLLSGAATTRPKHFSMYIESINSYNQNTKESKKSLSNNINIIDTQFAKPISNIDKPKSDQNPNKAIKTENLCYDETQIDNFNKKLHKIDKFESLKLNTKLLISEIKNYQEKEQITKEKIVDNKKNQPEIASPRVQTNNTPKTVKFLNENIVDKEELRSKSDSEKANEKLQNKDPKLDSFKQKTNLVNDNKNKNNNQISNDLDNLEKLANLLKEQASQAKQINRVIDIEKANQLYMKYFTTNGKLIKQNAEPVKKKIEIELSKNLDAKLVKTDQNTKIVITTTSINSDEKTQEIEKTAYFSSDEEEKEKQPKNTPKTETDINKIEITNDNFNQMNSSNNKEIEQVFNNFLNSKTEKEENTNDLNNLSQNTDINKRNGHVFDDNVNYSDITNENSQQTLIDQKADRRKTPVTMLRKIATPPPVPHILDKLRYLNVNELINKRSSKCGESIISSCSQAKTSQATISSDLISASPCKASTCEENNTDKKPPSPKNKKNLLNRRNSCHAPAQTISLNQEITVETKLNSQKQFNQILPDGDKIVKRDNSPSKIKIDSHLVIKVKEDPPVQKKISATNEENSQNSITVATAPNASVLTSSQKETCEKSEKSICKKSSNRKSNPFLDNSHYSIRNKYEGLTEIDRLREDKRPKSAYPFKEPVILKPHNIANHQYLVTPFDNLASLKTAAQYNNYYTTNNNNNRFNPFPYHYHHHNNINNKNNNNNNFHIQPNFHSYYNDEKFFDNFLNQITNGKDSKNDKSFYKYYAKENDRRKREGNSFLMLLPGIAIPIDTDAGESEDELSSSASN